MLLVLVLGIGATGLLVSPLPAMAANSSITIRSVNQNGQTITGYQTELFDSNGNLLATGSTPNTFTTQAGVSYSVLAESGASCSFAQWSGGVTTNPRPFTATNGRLSMVAMYNCGTAIKVSQTSTSDCVFVTACTVSLSSPVVKGDILVVLVTGYTNSATITGAGPFQPVSVGDGIGSSFTMYQGVSWTRSTDSFADDVFYAMVTSSASSDLVTIVFASEVQHADPIVISVAGHGLKVYSGNAADCTSGCTASIATGATSAPTVYLAAAEAYGDLGSSVIAGSSNWTPIFTGAYFMTGEYSTTPGVSSVAFPFTDESTPTTWGDAGIVISGNA